MKPRFLLSLLLALAFSSGISAKDKVYDLSDYGILPGSADKHFCSRLDSVLRLIMSESVRHEPVTIKLKRGRYDLYSSDAVKKELYISNHDQDQPKPVGIFLDGLENLTFDGQGAELVCHGRMIPLVLSNSHNCELRRFSIDFEQPQISQMEVLENKGDEGLVFRLAPWVNYRLADGGRLEMYGDDWAATPSGGMAFEKKTRHIVYNTGDIGVSVRGLTEISPRVFAAPEWRDARLVPGTVVAMRTWRRPCPGVVLSENVNTTLRKVKVHYSEGMGLIAQRCTDITLDKFDVCLKGKKDPRYFTTQADATHFSQCRGKIVSCNGLYENMMDDAINIHGVYLRVRERIDDHTLRCRYEHGQCWGFSWGDVGDTVQFVRSLNMDTVGAFNVIESIRPADKQDVAGCREFIVRLRDALPAAISAEEGYGIENLTWTPEVYFSGNTVRNNRARGALFSSPRRTVCEKNVFDHTSGTAILLCGDCNGWYESGAVRDLVIRRNKFINALTSSYQFTNAVISIYPEIPQLAAQKQYFHGGRKEAIVIEDNTFDTFDSPLLYAKSVDGLVFRNNKVKKNNEYEPRMPQARPVVTERCRQLEAPGYPQFGGNIITTK